VKKAAKCVICLGRLNNDDFKVKDSLVSGDYFSILECKNCGLGHTCPVPAEHNLGYYYKSVEYFSHTDKPRSLLQVVYQHVRKIMITKKIGFINKYSKNGKRILDYGCGTGDFLAKCVEKGWGACGLEPDIDARKIAEKSHNIKIADNLNELEHAETETFDVITLWHVIEHVYNLNETMIRLKKLLSENGVLVLAVPNRESYDAKHYKTKWGGYDVPRHLHHFNDKAIQSLAKRHGLIVIDRKPLIFDSFFVSLLSENQKFFPLRAVKALIIGSVSNIRAFFGLNPYSSLVYFLQSQ